MYIRWDALSFYFQKFYHCLAITVPLILSHILFTPPFLRNFCLSLKVNLLQSHLVQTIIAIYTFFFSFFSIHCIPIGCSIEGLVVVVFSIYLLEILSAVGKFSVMYSTFDHQYAILWFSFFLFFFSNYNDFNEWYLSLQLH